MIKIVVIDTYPLVLPVQDPKGDLRDMIPGQFSCTLLKFYADA
jgi:hypothetical protein